MVVVVMVKKQPIATNANRTGQGGERVMDGSRKPQRVGVLAIRKMTNSVLVLYNRYGTKQRKNQCWRSTRSDMRRRLCFGHAKTVSLSLSLHWVNRSRRKQGRPSTPNRRRCGQALFSLRTNTRSLGQRRGRKTRVTAVIPGLPYPPFGTFDPRMRKRP